MRVYFTFKTKQGFIKKRYCLGNSTYDLYGNLVTTFELCMSSGISCYDKKVLEIKKAYRHEINSLVFLGAAW
jgi:hypothetical protein